MRLDGVQVSRPLELHLGLLLEPRAAAVDVAEDVRVVLDAVERAEVEDRLLGAKIGTARAANVSPAKVCPRAFRTRQLSMSARQMRRSSRRWLAVDHDVTFDVDEIIQIVEDVDCRVVPETR